MPRLTADQWETIRAEREAGASFPDLAARHGVSHQAIQKHAKAEGWGDGQDVGQAIRRKVAEKVAGVVATDNPVKRAEALDNAAKRGVEVILRHQTETDGSRERLYAGLKAHKLATTKEEKQMAFEDLKAAKISSETMLNLHRAERTAFGLDVEAGKAEVTVKWEGGE